MAVVGARRASPYGLEMAYELGGASGRRASRWSAGWRWGSTRRRTVAAWTPGGPAIAVLAGGPDVPYPRSNLGLYERIHRDGIARLGGAAGHPPLPLELPGAKPDHGRAERHDGRGRGRGPVGVAHHQRSFAGQMGRTVAAVPGRANARLAAGANNLIKDGALVVTSAEDLLDDLFGVGSRPDPPARPAAAPADPVDASILEAVEADMDIDGICASAGLPVREARAALTRLERAGSVRRDGMGAYHRTA